jgi:hypothetical protein
MTVLNQVAQRALPLSLAVAMMAGVIAPSAALAANTDPPQRGKISGRSVGAGLLSLIIWPGIGQAVNNNKGQKVATHAIAGLLPPVRIWSGYDALVDRKGGYFNGKL